MLLSILCLPVALLHGSLVLNRSDLHNIFVTDSEAFMIMFQGLIPQPCCSALVNARVGSWASVCT
jgi:hypothetical protein